MPLIPHHFSLSSAMFLGFFCLPGLTQAQDGLTNPQEQRLGTAEMTASREGDLSTVDETIDLPLFQLGPTQIVPVQTLATGSIESIDATIGQRVFLGQVLAKSESKEDLIRFRRSLAALRAAGLRAASSPADSPQVQALQEAELAAAEEEFRAASQQLGRHVIQAPISGTLNDSRLKRHELFQAGDVVARITESDSLQLRIPLDGTRISLGQEVVVLTTAGRTTGRVHQFLSPSEGDERFHEVIPNLTIALIVLSNTNGSLQPGMTAAIVSPPYAIAVNKFLGTLNHESPSVYVMKEMKVSELPIEVIGSLQPGFSVVIGGFQKDETVVTVNDQGEPIPSDQVTIFSAFERIPSESVFETSLPKFAESLTKLPVAKETPALPPLASDYSLLANSPHIPQPLAGFLQQHEYPLCELDRQVLQEALHFDSALLYQLAETNKYFHAEALRRHLLPQDLETLIGRRARLPLSDFLHESRTFNKDYLQTLSLIMPESFQPSFALLRQIILIDNPANLEGLLPELKLEPNQQEQIELIKQQNDQQRIDYASQYVAGKLSGKDLLSAVTQLLASAENDLKLILNESQLALLDSIRAETKPAVVGSNPPPSSTVVTEKDRTTTGPPPTTGSPEPSPSEGLPRGLPAALQAKQESTFLPFLILGGSVLLVLVLLAIGYIVYKKRSG